MQRVLVSMLTRMVKVRLRALDQIASINEASAFSQQHLGFAPLGLPGDYATGRGFVYLWHLLPAWHAVLRSQGVETEAFVPQLVQLKKDIVLGNSEDGDKLQLRLAVIRAALQQPDKQVWLGDSTLAVRMICCCSGAQQAASCWQHFYC
jgi:hypothetical protein